MVHTIVFWSASTVSEVWLGVGNWSYLVKFAGFCKDGRNHGHGQKKPTLAVSDEE